MAYNTTIADRVREKLTTYPELVIEEKKMFGGLAFMINDKMCVNVSKDRLMCRFDPVLEEEVALRTGYQRMDMKGRSYKGFCYVNPEGFEREEDFDFWINLCLDFNARAKSSKRKKK